MPTKARDVLERMFHPAAGGLSTDLARHLLTVGFSEDDQERCRVLSEKAQEDALTPDERSELTELVTLNDLLIILHAKAESSLRRSPAA